MDLKVLGCHGGDTVKHRTSSFVLGGVLGVDCGATAGGMTLREQNKLRAVIISHAHLDHVRDLASLADNRCQGATEPLVVAGSAATLRALRKHFFNNVLWPDFTAIPLLRGGGMTIVLQPMRYETRYDIAGYAVRAIAVAHSIESAGFVIERDGRAVAYSGDTGPTDRFWQVLSETAGLRAVLVEVSFPNEMHALAAVSGHHTPATLVTDMAKLGGLHVASEMPMLLYHVKPTFEREVHRQLARVKGFETDVLALGDELIV